MDVDDLMSVLDAEGTTVSNPDEAREVTQNLVHTLALLTLSSKEERLQTTVTTDIQRTNGIGTQQSPGEATGAGMTSQGAVTPTPTRATISAEQIKHATVSLFFQFFHYADCEQPRIFSLRASGKNAKTERIAF